MSIKRNRIRIPLVASAMLAVVAMSPRSTLHAQDLSKSIQVEAPLVKLLEGKVESLLSESESKSNDFASSAVAILDRLGDQKSAEGSSANLPAVDRSFSKAFIETPTKQLVDPGRIPAGRLTEVEVAPSVESKAKPNNPPVEPGLVDWHTDLAAAALQSKNSGKPVFHFQLLGQLDQRFT